MEERARGRPFAPTIGRNMRWVALGVRVAALLVLAGTVAIIIIRLWDIPRCLPSSFLSTVGACTQRRQYVEDQILTAVEGLFFTAALFVGAHVLEQLTGQSAEDEEPGPGDGPAADAQDRRS